MAPRARSLLSVARLLAPLPLMLARACGGGSGGKDGKAEAKTGDAKAKETALAGLEGIPVDIRPVYPVAGETAPR
jgi:hypothetical protein